MKPQDTKEHILDVAEQLFAERGYAATSLRAITQQAGVNLGAVNYHFGSKETLLCDVFERRLAPLNAERLRRLDTLESGTNGATLEAILNAFVAPVFSMGHQAPHLRETFMRLIGRLYTEPVDGLPALYERLLGKVLRRFVQALGRVLPACSSAELYWRMHFLVGMLIHPLMAGAELTTFTEGLCTFDDPTELTERVVAFAAAGMQSPPATSQKRYAEP